MKWAESPALPLLPEKKRGEDAEQPIIIRENKAANAACIAPKEPFGIFFIIDNFVLTIYKGSGTRTRIGTDWGVRVPGFPVVADAA